jgi:hypothetical protein
LKDVYEPVSQLITEVWFAQRSKPFYVWTIWPFF